MNNLSFSRGHLLIVLSTVLYASHGIWSKWLLPYVDALTSSWTRSLIVVLLLVPILLIRKTWHTPKRGELRSLAAVCIPGCLVTPLYFYAFESLTVGTATLLFFSAYALTAMVLGIVFFKEKAITRKIVALLLGMVGLVFVSGGPVVSGHYLAVAAGVLAGACGAAEVTFTKRLPRQYSPFAITMWVYLLTLVVTLPLAAVYSEISWPFIMPIEGWLLSVGYCLAIIGALVLVITGIRTVEPGAAGLLGLLEIVFGVLFGILLFFEQLTLGTTIGMVLIVLAAGLPFVSKRVSSASA